jgi:hypothetical protein
VSFFKNVSENFGESSATIMVYSGERSWTASSNKFSKCCGTIPLFPPSEVPFLVMFLMMPTLVGQVTGFCSTNLILFTLSKLFDSVQSSSAKRDTGFLLPQVQYPV